MDWGLGLHVLGFGACNSDLSFPADVKITRQRGRTVSGHVKLTCELKAGGAPCYITPFKEFGP